MKGAKILLSAILGASVLNADVQNTESNPDSQTQQKVAEVAKGLLDGVKFKGFALMRYSGVSGNLGHGAGQQYRLKMDMTTGQVQGYSLTAGIFMNQGTSTPQINAKTDGAVQGSMGYVYQSFGDRFGLSVFSANKNIKFESVKIDLKAGRMNLATSINDKNMDVFTGVFGVLNSGTITLGLGYFDAWISNNMAYNFRDLRVLNTTNGSLASAAQSVGADLSLIFVDGKKLGSSGFDFNATLANAQGIFDYMAFVSAKYDFGAFHILAQGAATGFNKEPIFRHGGGNSANYGNLSKWGGGTQGRSTQTRPNYGGFTGDDRNDWASNRGLYNIQLGVKFGDFKAKAGYVGSFGQGYGVLLDYKGALDMAGKFWNSNYDTASEGFGIMGSGGRKGTSISVGYLGLTYALSKSFTAGLDYSYVSGNNNYAFNSVASQAGIKNNAKGITFSEIAPSLTYKIKGFSAGVIYARNAGDVNWGKTRVELRYDF